MIPATASVGEISHAPISRRGGAEVVATMGGGAKERHDQLPLGTVRSDASAMQGPGDQMGNFMGYGLIDKGSAILLKQLWVIADHGAGV